MKNIIIIFVLLLIVSCSTTTLTSKYDGKKVKWTLDRQGNYVLLSEKECPSCYLKKQ